MPCKATGRDSHDSHENTILVDYISVLCEGEAVNSMLQVVVQ